MLSLRDGPKKKLLIGWIKMFHRIPIGELSRQKGKGYHHANANLVMSVLKGRVNVRSSTLWQY